MDKVRIGFLGCGRMGKLHMANLINNVPNCEVVAVSDPAIDKFGNREWCLAHGITNLSDDFHTILDDPTIDAVFVCSSTDMHCPLSLASIKAGKHTFCEKPITYDVPQLLELVEACKASDKKYMVGFNRRFDHNHRAVAEAVKSGKIGKVRTTTVISRDPEPPTYEYVTISGGLFYDMMIHDFDMVRYVSGSEAVEISAVGACLVDPDLQKKSGIPDVDTAIVTMKMADGSMAQILNCRENKAGYDQRVEVQGDLGLAKDDNDYKNTAVVEGAAGGTTSLPMFFFLDRYAQAFVDEAKSFVNAIIEDKPVETGVMDGLIPVLMAQAATESCRNQGGNFVKVEKPY